MFKWDELRRGNDGKVKLLYRHERILSEKIVVAGARVLDVGGWGVLAQRLIEEGVDCTILDNFSEDQYYPDRVRALPHICGSILDAALVESLGKYDVVTCFEMLEHCVEQRTAISHMSKLLFQGGSLVGTFPLPGFSHAVDDPHVTFLSAEELKELFESVGFFVQCIEPTASVSVNDEPCSLYFVCRKVTNGL